MFEMNGRRSTNENLRLQRFENEKSIWKPTKVLSSAETFWQFSISSLESKVSEKLSRLIGDAIV